MAPKQRILKLPKVLIDQLGGGGETLSGERKSRPRAGSRKELRKAARVEKRASRSGPPPAKRVKVYHEEDRGSNGKAPSALKPPSAVILRKEPEREPEPRSILKLTKTANFDLRISKRCRSVTPPPKMSRAVQDKLTEEDEEIAALEKKLGLKGKKGLPQSFKDDGLDELLQGLGGENDDSDGFQQKRKRKAEGDEWLERKRTEARIAAQGNVAAVNDNKDDSDLKDEDSEAGDSAGDQADEEDGTFNMSLDEPEFLDDVSGHNEGDLQEDILDVNNDFDGFDSNSEPEQETKHPLQRIRENPYVAPSAGSNAPTEKYIPPSLRKAAASDSAELTRLRRRIQGLVNRITEANMISILADTEKVYRENPRQHVTSTLVDILLSSVCEPTNLPDTLIILPAGFIAAIYKIIGTDFGANITQRIVQLFDEHYAHASVSANTGPAAAKTDSSKETSNLIMLLSEMYNFQVVGSNLMFDYIKIFLEKLSELNAELLLKIIRASGPQLRQDDPSSLKGIVAMLRPAIESAGGEASISVRTKFMVETINDLKNNKMKTGGAASAITSEHTIRMKKILGSLNTRAIKGSEPLRIGLKDIQDSDKKGKWWLVGASWSGNADVDVVEPSASDAGKKRAPAEDKRTSDIFQLAREQRMNTDIRRAIFVTIMSASDYQDAHIRLMKLKLKKVQEFEIPKVLIHCAVSERIYNPYYALIAKKVCGDRRLKTAFQYCLWDLFKKMGESEEDEVDPDAEEDALDTRQIVNLAKMFGTLVADGGLSLSALKNLNFSYLQTRTKIFLEVFFITAFLQCQRQAGNNRDEQALRHALSQAKETPQLIRGLQYFLKKVVSKTDIAGGEEEKATVKRACKVADDTLKALAAAFS